MAFTVSKYGKCYANLLGGEVAGDTFGVDFLSDTIKCMLMTNTYAVNLDTHETKADITNEVTGTNYTAGGTTLASKTITYTAADSFGTARANSTAYAVGDIFRPATGNGHLYRVIVAGTSGGAPPTFPTVSGNTVADGTATIAEIGRGLTQIDFADPSWASALPRETVQQQIQRIVEDMLATDDTPLSRQEREQLVVEVQHETFGLGPIEPLMQDPTVSDILVNGPRAVYVERRGRLERTRVIFRDDTHLLQVIERIVSRMGRRVDESSPMVDARLPDGSRVNAIIPPLALDGPVLSVRRFAVDPLKTEDLIELNTWTPALSELIRAAVKARLNLLISGGTGSGKTTLLNVISEAIPNHERIVTVEDSAELQLQQEHKVRLETRPANIEGVGSVTQRDLVRNALRMRPDRIIVGEVRGPEVLDMLQAMNTGHDGSLSTVHANSTRDALARIETMILLSGISLPVRAMRDYIASALDVIVHLSRLSDGSRKILRVTEVVGMEEDVVTTQDIFVFEQEGIDKDGKVIGYHRATGVRPKFADRLRRAGIDLDPELFNPNKRQAVR